MLEIPILGGGRLTESPSRPLSSQNPIFPEISALTAIIRRPTTSSAFTSKTNEQPFKDAKKRNSASKIIFDKVIPQLDKTLGRTGQTLREIDHEGRQTFRL